MGSKASILLQEQEIEQIQKETGFSRSQIVRLYSRFTTLDASNNGYLSREDFLRIPELAINPLGDRIVHAFFEDENMDGVNFRQFMHVLAHFRPISKNSTREINSKTEKLRFCFKMYDIDGEGTISKDELLAVLHMMVGANIPQHQLESIADRTMKEADRDGDQEITFEEFCKLLEKVDIENKMSLIFLG